MANTRIHFLSDDQLKNLSPQRLLNVLKSARAVESNILHYHGSRCCEICHEYMGGNWEEDVLKYSEPFTQYIFRVKKVLSNKQHVIRRKKAKKVKK